MPDPQTDSDAPAGRDAAHRAVPPERFPEAGRSLPDEPVTNEPVPTGGDEADVGLTEGNALGGGPGFDVEEAAAYRENDA